LSRCTHHAFLLRVVALQPMAAYSRSRAVVIVLTALLVRYNAV